MTLVKKKKIVLFLFITGVILSGIIIKEKIAESQKNNGNVNSIEDIGLCECIENSSFNAMNLQDNIINNDQIDDLELVNFYNQGTRSFDFSKNDEFMGDTSFTLVGALSLVGTIYLYNKYAKNNSTSLNVTDLRESILHLVESEPGIHFKKICRVIARQNGVTRYHLKYLETVENSLLSHQDGKYLRFFPNTQEFLENITRELISSLHHESSNKIIDKLLQAKNPQSSFTLSNELGYSRQWVSKVCNNLVDQNIIESTLKNKEKFYNLIPEIKIRLDVLF